MRHMADAETMQSQADAFRRWAALPRIRAQAEDRATAMAARTAARTVQDAFTAWAAYAAAMSDAIAVRADDAFLQPRSSEVRSWSARMWGSLGSMSTPGATLPCFVGCAAVAHENSQLSALSIAHQDQGFSCKQMARPLSANSPVRAHGNFMQLAHSAKYWKRS